MSARLGTDTNPKDWAFRIGFLGTGLVLFNTALTLWVEGQPMQHPLSLGLSFVAWAVGMALLVLALTPHPHSRLAWLVLVALLFTLLAHAYIVWLNYSPLTTYHTDNEMITEYAAQVLKRGENPYTWNFSDMLRVYRDPGPSFTPFLDGAIQHRVTYPALPVLVLLGFDWFGMGQVRTISLFFHLLLLILIFVGTPQRFRPIVLLPFFLLRESVPFTLGGIQDIVWSALLIAVILAWKRPLWRAVLFGMASSFRQQPWFVLPFLLIYIWNEPGSPQDRRHRIVHFLAVSVAVFVFVNLPFILWDPEAWCLGTFEPAYAQFDVVSVGLGALTQNGLMPFPREFYTILQISSYLTMLVIHWRHPRGVGQAFWIFPGIFFWLYYRGLPNYWIYWIPPLLLAFTRLTKDQNPFLVQAAKPRSPWKPVAALAASLLFVNLLWGLILLWLGSPIEVRYTPPFETISYGEPLVNRIRVTVTNRSSAVLLPRFAVQRESSIQALPWAIDSGPESLAPGQSGEYVITASSVPIRMFPVSSGGQIVVTDAGGDYWLRAVLTIPGDSSNAKLADPHKSLADALAHSDVYYTNLGDGYRGQRNYDLAATSYTRALTYNSSNANAYFGLGESKFWSQDYAEAIEAFRSSLAFGYSQPALVHRGIGWSQYSLGKYDAARQHFEEAIRLQPDFADAYNGLGWTDVQSGDCDRAIPNFQLALKFDPRLAGAKSGLQLCQR